MKNRRPSFREVVLGSIPFSLLYLIFFISIQSIDSINWAWYIVITPIWVPALVFLAVLLLRKGSD